MTTHASQEDLSPERSGRLADLCHASVAIVLELIQSLQKGLLYNYHR